MKTRNISTSAFLPRTGKLADTPGLIRNQRKKCLLSAPLLILAACAIGQTAEAQTNPTTPINSCGTVISEPGNYIVSNSMQSTSETVDCIQVDSPGVGLTVPHQLTGPGGSNVTAAGIRVTSKASGVWLLLGGATIEGFGAGLVVEGSGVSVNSGTTKGNAVQGVLVSNATNITIYGLESTANGQSGLELSNASGVIVDGATSLDSNEGNGLWLHSSSGNQFFYLLTSSNVQDGVYVGEADVPGKRENGEAARPFSSLAKCSTCIGQSSTTSQHNVFVSGAVIENHGSGIAIGAGDSANIVTGMAGLGSGDNDAVDKNENCTLNTWTKNDFRTVAPSCIH